MDNFLDYLIKKSDLNKNEYFNYRPSRVKTEKSSEPFVYEKILEPVVNDYVVFDLETTGMKPVINNIIEIGAVKVIKGEISGIFNTLINPEQFIPYYIANITNISNDMVKDKETIKDVLPKFVSFIGDLPLIAHNARFDMSFLLTNAKRQNICINNPVLDTLYLSRKYNKECEKHNLAYLTKYFDIKLDNAHRAYFDALATNQVYKCIQQIYTNSSK